MEIQCSHPAGHSGLRDHLCQAQAAQYVKPHLLKHLLSHKKYTCFYHHRHIFACMKTPTGILIKRLRQQKDQKQADLAKSLNLTVPAYSKIEAGITDINLSRLFQIAALFGVAPSSLLAGADTEEDPVLLENNELKGDLDQANTQSSSYKAR